MSSFSTRKSTPESTLQEVLSAENVSALPVVSSSMRADVLQHLHDALWQRYQDDVGYVKNVQRAVKEACGLTWHNDHIALRSLRRAGRPLGDGILPLARPFLALGYRVRAEYQFADVHLAAVYLSPDENLAPALAHEILPRVFISECDVSALPTSSQQILEKYDAILASRQQLTEAWQAWPDFFARPAASITDTELDQLHQDSQYAAWVMLFGNQVNHFTATTTDIDKTVQHLRDWQIPMKKQVEGNPASGLEQTATLAYPVEVSLHGGITRTYPYAYVEVAKRYGDFDGFLAPQARQLFEMTR